MASMKLHETEKTITKAIRELLRIHNVWHFKVHQGLGSAPGVADIVGIYDGGRLLAIEVKTSRGRLSPAQERFLQNVRDRGGLGFVARGVEDVIRELGLKVLL